MRTHTILLLLLFFAGHGPAAAPPAAPLSEVQVQQLIRQLGSDDFHSREEATRRLLHRLEAEPVLRAALRSPDREVVRRARSLLAVLHQDRLQRVREQMRDDVAQGRADLLVERLVQWQGPDDDDPCWQAVLDLSQQLRTWDSTKFKRIPQKPAIQKCFPGPAFRPYMQKVGMEVLPPGRPLLEKHEAKRPQGNHNLAYLARGERVMIDRLRWSLVTSSGPASLGAGAFIRSPGYAHGSFVLCGDSVELNESNCLVVVCDGDLKVHFISNSIIVASGSVRVTQAVVACVVLAGGDVSFGDGIYLPRSTVHAGGNVAFAGRAALRSSTVHAAGTIFRSNREQVRDCDLKGGVPSPPWPVKFFDPSTIGVEAAPSRYGVRVSAAAPDKPFAKAGLEVDDLVVAVDGVPARHPAAFRRLLRKRVVLGGAALVDVRRAGKSRVVRVPLGR